MDPVLRCFLYYMLGCFTYQAIKRAFGDKTITWKMMLEVAFAVALLYWFFAFLFLAIVSSHH